MTGGAGFIGSHVADALLADGHDVAIVDDLSSGRRENVPERATFFEGDIRDGDFVERMFRDFSPEVISHQAAQTSVSVSTREPIRDAEINVLGSLHVLDAAVRHKTHRIIFASTGGAIYGEVPENQRATPEWSPKPLSPYACSKLAFEGYLRSYQHEHGLNYTILRYANVYGPRQDPHGEAGVVAIFSERLAKGEGIRINAMREEGDDGCIRDYVYVDDVVAANRKAIAEELDAPIVNVATGEPTSTKQLAERISAALGVESSFGFGGRRAGDLERSVLEPGLGTKPVSLQEGIEKTTDWFNRRLGS